MVFYARPGIPLGKGQLEFPKLKLMKKLIA